MRLGLFDIMQIDPLDPSSHAEVYARRLDQLEEADQLGLDLAFVAERHFLANYRSPAGTAWIGAASQRTKRMRLGVLAYTVPIHDPVQLAEEIAVLDHLSNGRLEVGLGLGHRPEELVARGQDPATRIEVFQQRLAIMQALWTGGRVTLATDYDTINSVAINPVPLQEPHPPIWYAGTSIESADWAGNNGFNMAVGFQPLRALQTPAAHFRIAQGNTSDKPVGSLALMRQIYIAESDQQALEEMIGDLIALSAYQVELGARSEPIDRDEAEREVMQLAIDEIFFAGSAQSVAEKIATARRALGIDTFLANPWGAGMNDDRVRRTIALLATEVRDYLAISA